ncbi:MAG: 23S rRNA (guanosine(2251)-2'-O)-methyltransferase RlmB [Myxococcota bacterium]
MPRTLLGPHAVREALRARRDVSLVYVLEGNKPGDIEALARSRGIEVVPRSHEALERLAEGWRHQGVVAIAGEFPYVDLDELLATAKEPPLLLVLDSIQDPHNLGALVRSACVLGADGVVLPRDRAAKVTPAVVRASAGTTEHIRIALVTNLARAISEMTEQGLTCIAAMSEGGAPPWEVDLRRGVALVVGAEDKGVRRLVGERCGERVTIPASPLAPLNVSVAGALLLYEARRQRSASG